MSACIIRASRLSMGTEFEVIAAGQDAAYLEAAANEALDEIERLEARLSHYEADSEICDLNLRAPYEEVLVSPDLFQLLEEAVAYSRASWRAFDPAAGALIRCWGFFRGEGRMPGQSEIDQALQRTGSQLLGLNPATRTVRFATEGVQVHLGAIGKGCAVDAAAGSLRRNGVASALVHGGRSTIYAIGGPPGEEEWEVGLKDPSGGERRAGFFRLRDRALSTSGDYEQFFTWEGRRYSHLLDPRTGWPARGTRSATVLGDSATATDALSTAAFVLGAGGAEDLLRQFPRMGCAVISEPEEDEEEPALFTWGEVQLLPDEPASPGTGM